MSTQSGVYDHDVPVGEEGAHVDDLCAQQHARQQGMLLPDGP